MRTVQVLKNVSKPRDPEKPNCHPGFSRVPEYTAKFHQFGIHYEELQSGPGHYTTAILERDDGTIVEVSAGMIQFIESADSTHSDLVDALQTIAAQSTGDDWTPEQAVTFIKQHARAALAKAGVA